MPLSILALEVPAPIAGWDGLLEQQNIRQLTDHLGRKAISAAAARRLLATLKRQDELFLEDAQRRTERLSAKRPAAGGLPYQEGMSPAEVMAASPGYQLPSDEFQGNPKPRFLAEELAEGQRADDEKKREAAARKAERLADSLKDKLSGKR